MGQALAGIRIIDITHNRAASACAPVLGTLGAEVIELDEPEGSDLDRRHAGRHARKLRAGALDRPGFGCGALAAIKPTGSTN